MRNKVLLGVTGGVAAYKSLEILRLLIKRGIEVRVVITKGGERFVTPFSFLSLGAKEVFTDSEQFSIVSGSSIHLSLSRWADVILVAPATADFIAKVSSGISDTLLLTTLLAYKGEVIVAPSMNENMYLHPVTKRNIEILKSIGYKIIEPEVGALADLATGIGRLKDVEDIVEEVLVSLSEKKLLGKRVLVTAGATREFIDPVRFISNASSGRMGFAFARVARRLGAEVILVCGAVKDKPPRVHKFIEVTTTEEMLKNIKDELENCDILVMAAAPSDYRPKVPVREKLPKLDTLSLELVTTPDILKEVSIYKGNRIFIGFALETTGLIEHAKRKLEEKNLDFIIANDIANIGSPAGKIILIDKSHNIEAYEGDKESIAYFVFSKIT